VEHVDIKALELPRDGLKKPKWWVPGSTQRLDSHAREMASQRASFTTAEENGP
jgi:hypothetical protein